MDPMKSLAILAAGAIAAAASGQEWRFALSNPVLSPDAPSTTVTASIDAGPGAWAFAGANLDVHATELGWSDPTALFKLPGQAPGTVSGASVTGISVAQFRGFGGWAPGFPKVGRAEVWQATFTVTDFTPRQLELSTATRRLEVYLEEALLTRETRIPLEAERVIQVIPAPGGIALGLGAFVAAARRRRPDREQRDLGRPSAAGPSVTREGIAPSLRSRLPAWPAPPAVRSGGSI